MDTYRYSRGDGESSTHVGEGTLQTLPTSAGAEPQLALYPQGY